MHKDDIRVGDIILCKDGEMRTVCRNNIKYDSFMGLSLFGDTYKLGYEKVKRVILHKILEWTVDIMSKSYITTVEIVRSDLPKNGTISIQDAKVVLHLDWNWYFGRFGSMEQLEELARFLGFTYELVEERETVNNGIYREYTMSHEIDSPCDGGFWKVSDLPEEVKPFKALSNGSIVTCYSLNDGQVIHIYRPNPNAKEVYKPLNLQDHIVHCKQYGTY